MDEIAKLHRIDPDSLIGEHILSAAVLDALQGGEQVLRFTLDGKHYEAVEDKEDGYRTSFDYLIETGLAPFASFEPASVTVRESADKQHQCWEFISHKTGLVCMEFGTTDLDDYYPGFVGYFEPHNV